jgi:hypothetical protein
MAIKQYAAFTPPSPYEQERRKAEQMRRYAELLQEQAMAEDEPYTFQGIRAMPSPAAALGKLLKAYGSKKAAEKADEAEARKAGMEQQASQQIMGRLTGGAPVSMVDTTPDESGLAEVAVQSQYRQDPADAMRFAATPQGVGAMKGNPMLAAMLTKSMETPKGAEYGTTVQYDSEGRGYVVSKTGDVRYLKDVKKPAESLVDKPSPADFTPASIAKFSKSENYADLVPVPRPSSITNINMPSEGERKDAYNLARVVNAASTINAATKTEPGAAKPGLKEAAVGTLPGIDEASYLAQSPQRQVVTAAQTDMIDALLTLATGAAYTKEQLAGQRAAILPRFGESKESIAAKKQRVQDLATAARIRAGRAWTPEMDKAIEAAFGPIEEEPITDLPPPRR